MDETDEVLPPDEYKLAPLDRRLVSLIRRELGAEAVSNVPSKLRRLFSPRLGGGGGGKLACGRLLNEVTEFVEGVRLTVGACGLALRDGGGGGGRADGISRSVSTE
jgi:hypothetical protein